MKVIILENTFHGRKISQPLHITCHGGCSHAKMNIIHPLFDVPHPLMDVSLRLINVSDPRTAPQNFWCSASKSCFSINQIVSYTAHEMESRRNFLKFLRVVLVSMSNPTPSLHQGCKGRFFVA
jgi:hypothetical protein